MEAQIDRGVVARAAEAGQLEWLQWAAQAGYSALFDGATLSYALAAGRCAVAEWMLRDEVPHWHTWYAPYDQAHLQAEARALGLDEALVARIPQCRYMQ